MFSEKYEGTVVTKDGKHSATVLVNLETGIFEVPETDENLYDIVILEGQASTGIFYVTTVGFGIYGCKKPQHEMLQVWVKENTIEPIYISDIIERVIKKLKKIVK